MPDERPDGEALLEIGMHRTVLFGRGQRAGALRDVAPYDLEGRLPDEELFLERQIEEGESLLVAGPHQGFVDPVPGHCEETDLLGRIVDLPGNGLASLRIAGAKRRQIDDWEGTFAHDGTVITHRV